MAGAPPQQAAGSPSSCRAESCCARPARGHWPDESPAEFTELKKTGKATIQNAIWLSRVDLFKGGGPQMTGRTSP